MLSTQSTPSKHMSSIEVNPPRSARGLNPQTPSFVPSSPLRGPGTANEALDNWFDGFGQHQSTLQAMAEASMEPKFQEELGTIEQWFKVLSEPERTASIYALIQHSSQSQIRFFIAVLQQMVRASDGPNSAIDGQQTNNNPRSLRPPSLNLPMPRTPGTPQFSAGLPSGAPDSGEKAKLGQIAEGKEPEVPLKSGLNVNDDWASMVNTPLGNMFPKGGPASTASPKGAGFDANGLPVSMVNGFNNMNMMGVSQEAQLLAMQLVMSGMVQPGMPLPQQLQNQGGKGQRKNSATGGSANWRSAAQQGRYPRSALKSPGAKSTTSGTGGKSAALASAGLKSTSSMGSTGTPREEDIDPELLKDVPAWLKSLRLHKYTSCFDGMTWEQMVDLDDAALEKKGVAALGARRRLSRTFENVRKKMGMEPLEPSAATDGDSVTIAPSSDMPSIASITSPLRNEATD